MGNKADISIITSLYQSERHLHDYRQHLLKVVREMKESGFCIEIILISNKPTPKEKRYLGELQLHLEHHANVRLEFVPRETLYSSWNRGIKLATAPVLGFWNVDDIRNAEALREGYRLIQDGHPLVYFSYVAIPSKLDFTRYGLNRLQYADLLQISEAAFRSEFLIGPFFLFAARLIKEVGFFDAQFRIAGDYDWQIRAAKHTTFKRGTSIGGLFIFHGKNLCGQGNPRHEAELNIIYKRYGLKNKLNHLSPLQQQLFNNYKIEEPFSPNVYTESANNYELDKYCYTSMKRERMFMSLRNTTFFKVLRTIYKLVISR